MSSNRRSILPLAIVAAGLVAIASPAPQPFVALEVATGDTPGVALRLASLLTVRIVAKLGS